jgi:hypothetical protein
MYVFLDLRADTVVGENDVLLQPRKLLGKALHAVA